MPIYIEAPCAIPDEHAEAPAIFLAGGITDCPDWQAGMVQQLQSSLPAEWVILSPRRENFPIGDPDAAQAQIEWEAEALIRADAILFWFPCETICPIVLYELGAWSMARKPIFIGMHPYYKRRQDVEIQTALRRPEVKIVYDLKDLAAQVIALSENFSTDHMARLLRINQAMVDIVDAEGVEVRTDSMKHKVWVNVDGVCALRVGHAKEVNYRRPKATACS